MICKVKKDSGACRQGLLSLWVVDKFFNGKLHSLDNEVGTIWNTDCKVEWEEMSSKFVAERAGDVGTDEATYCGGNAKGAEFCVVFGVLVETEEIYVGEITFDGFGEGVLID